MDREAISPRESFECKAKHATSLRLLSYHLRLYVNPFGIFYIFSLANMGTILKFLALILK